ncbi:HAD family hydrolase [Promicromonospora sp. Populi]|uniref:HAD family hydrolase n=1 Tax=Promicromonospora sp. Populi TaxID=3239420 RepID=UPI0034E249A4
MTPTQPQTQPARLGDVAASVLVACDIDGTLVHTGHPATAAVRAAAAEVRAAGHHIVLATGRSLAGALPVALELGLDDAWIVASNGAVTAHLVGDRYQVTEQHTVDAEDAIRVAVAAAPGMRIAAEIVGTGYRVNLPFPDGELNGTQHSVTGLEQLWADPTPRLALHGPSAYRMVWALRALNLTAIATRADWIDITPPGISKATALEKVRTELGIEDHNTVAIGDSENDIEMLNWAATSHAMAHAPAFVIAAADHTTGTIDDDGAASALLSLLN